MSQKNIDRLVELVQHRLNSKGQAKSTDINNDVVYVDCDVFSREMLEAFLHISLSDFNQTPYFTFYTFADDNVVNVFTDVLVEGAVIQALASQALLERGREFHVEDSGVRLDPPSVSELLNTQFSTLLTHHFEKLKLIKSEIKSFNLS